MAGKAGYPVAVRLGSMNNPARDVLKEIARVKEMGFDFVDLTLEPPAARADKVDGKRLKSAIDSQGLGVIGHTAYYLPFASAFDAVRAAAVAEAEQCLEVFAQVGARLMNIHLDCHVPGHDAAFINHRNIESLEMLFPTSDRLGITLMVENAEGDDADTLGPVLDALPQIGLHLDIGHANIGAGRRSHTKSLLDQYGHRLRHVHLSDNKGRSDDHLAIGAGTIDWRRELRAVKAAGYDGTFTLEVFYGDSSLIPYSLNRVRELWRSL